MDAPMTIRPWHIAVLIPARNEEDLLPRCLRSVQAARKLLPNHVTSDVIVAVDCSTDQTIAVADCELRESGLVVRSLAGVVGAARSIAADIALKRYQGPHEYCWLANTDADCVVPPDWLLKQLSIAEQGFQAAAGIVDVDDFTEHLPHVAERFRLTYLIRRDGTHPHVHGANLGVRADAYLIAGGWRSLATAEDHNLWGRLSRSGCRQVSASRLRVVTSGRRLGRAPHGFAQALAAHNETSL